MTEHKCTDPRDPEFWRDAPEGATHYAPPQGPFIGGWYREVDRVAGDAMFHDEDSRADWLCVGDLPETLIARPTAWTGEGLPPVGTVCEVWYDNGRECWREAEILASDRGPENACAAMLLDGDEQYKLIWALDYRPIRTEQERVIDSVMQETTADEDVEWALVRGYFEKAYSLGYLRDPKEDE